MKALIFSAFGRRLRAVNVRSEYGRGDPVRFEFSRSSKEFRSALLVSTIAFGKESLPP